MNSFPSNKAADLIASLVGKTERTVRDWKYSIMVVFQKLNKVNIGGRAYYGKMKSSMKLSQIMFVRTQL